MQKNYIISCCAECPAFGRNGSVCKKEEKAVNQDTSNPVDLALLGFPEWCPLSDGEIAGGSLDADLKKVARQILKRLGLEFDDDIVTSIFHYLNTVVVIKEVKTANEKGGLKNG